jgi:hypothetical protein
MSTASMKAASGVPTPAPMETAAVFTTAMETATVGTA